MAVTFEQLRRMRDAASLIGSKDLQDALQELIHLRVRRERVVDGVVTTSLCDERIEPEDLRW